MPFFTLGEGFQGIIGLVQLELVYSLLPDMRNVVLGSQLIYIVSLSFDKVNFFLILFTELKLLLRISTGFSVVYLTLSTLGLQF
jgi:hypothetical protein